jgi:hypothetical protein
MPVEALWRWLREDVIYHHCHATAKDVIRRVAAFVSMPAEFRISRTLRAACSHFSAVPLT